MSLATDATTSNQYQLRSVWEVEAIPYSEQELKKITPLFSGISSVSCLTQNREQFYQTVATIAAWAKEDLSRFDHLKHAEKFYFADRQENLNLGVPGLVGTLINTGFILACLINLAAVLQGDRILLGSEQRLVPERLMGRLKRCGDFMKEALQANALKFSSNPETQLQIQENLLSLGLVTLQSKVALVQELENTNQGRVYQLLSKDPDVVSTLYNSNYQLRSLTQAPSFQGLLENSVEITPERRQELVTLVRTYFPGTSSRKEISDEALCLLVRLAAEHSFIEECIKDQPYDATVAILIHISIFVGLLAVVRGDKDLFSRFITLSNKLSELKVRTALSGLSEDCSFDRFGEISYKQANMIEENIMDRYENMSPKTKLEVYENMLHLGLISPPHKLVVFDTCTHICRGDHPGGADFYGVLSKDPALAFLIVPNKATSKHLGSSLWSLKTLSFGMVALGVLGAMAAACWTANTEG